MSLLPSAVVVGVDGSEESLLALDWAAFESVRLTRPLLVLLVHDDLSQVVARGDRVREDDARARMDLLMATVYERLMVTPAEDFLVNLVGGPPARALLEAAASARMLVLGSRAWARRVGWRASGSVSRRVIDRVRCPVVVVRPPWDPGSRTVLVGLGGAGSQGALSFGLDLASRNQLSVLALAWRETATSELLAGLAASYPDVELSRQAVTGNPLTTLAEASRHASLAVIGTPERGLSVPARSLNHRLLRQAHCPVAIAR